MTLNGTTSVSQLAGDDESITKDDAAWILTNAFLVLTMQSGFGLLEAGCVSHKNIANIMVKNVVDVTCGGFSYWALGYGISFGESWHGLFGSSNFFLRATDERTMGTLYTHYVFQFSFATAATTIVSGAVAERMRLTAYMAFSVLNTFVYCVPCFWAWNRAGFLYALGFFDFAGACVVHATGGASSLAASIILGPRIGRFGESDKYSMSSPVTALTGTFMLWWAWLGFNCGSTFGLSNGMWKVGAKVGVNTLNGSIAGGITGIALSVMVFKTRHYDIGYMITSILGGLVSVTAACAVIDPHEALLLGAAGAASAIGASALLERAKVDDPVGAVPVHLVAATVGTLGVGIFGRDDFGQLGGNVGLLYGGGFYLLGVQLLGIVTMASFSIISTIACFLALRHTIGLRVSAEEELLGADWVEHRVRSLNLSTKLEVALGDMHLSDDGMESVIKKLVSELGGEANATAANGNATTADKQTAVNELVRDLQRHRRQSRQRPGLLGMPHGSRCEDTDEGQQGGPPPIVRLPENNYTAPQPADDERPNVPSARSLHHQNGTPGSHRKSVAPTLRQNRVGLVRQLLSSKNSGGGGGGCTQQ